MSAASRKAFKKRIGPKIARSKNAKRVRFLVVAPMLAGDTKERMRSRIKAHIELHEPCPVKVQSLAKDDRVVGDAGWTVKEK